MPPRRLILLLVQLTVSAAALAWVLRQPEMRTRISSLWAQADAGWLVLGACWAGLTLALSMFRWRLFLHAQELTVPWPRLTGICLIGAFFDLALPGTAGGDAAKAFYICRAHPGRKGRVLLTLVADHLSGLLALAVYAACFAGARASFFQATPLSHGLFVYTGGFLVFSLAGVGLAFAITGPGALKRLHAWLPGAAKIREMSEAFQLFRHRWRPPLAACGLSFVIFPVHFATFHAAAHALGVKASMADLLTIMPVVDVVTMLPVSVSGLGVRETLFEELLTRLVHSPPGTAAAVSLTGFACMMLWGLAGGALLPFFRGRDRS